MPGVDQLPLPLGPTRPLRDPPAGAKPLSDVPCVCRCGARGFVFGWLIEDPYTERETTTPLCLDCTCDKARTLGYPPGFAWCAFRHSALLTTTV